MDGQEESQVLQPETMDGQAPASVEPVDIAQAFQMVREADKAAAKPVEPEGESEPVAGQPAAPEPEPPVPAQPVYQAGTGTAGGPADIGQGDVYQSRQQELMNEIVSYAKYQATEDFRKNGVKKWSIQDLHHRDEESGTVSFIDPDTGEDLHSREKAQAWINSMNSQIDESYNKKVRDNATKMFNNARPVFELLQFAPTYQKMDDMTKDVFEDIVAPYALADANGNIMGYSCNLNAAAQQAASIVGRFKQARQQPQQQAVPQQQPQQQQPKAPAMDMKTGASSSPEDDEPKTLEEAMRRINEKNRGKSNG